MSDRYPAGAIQQNNILRAELGENPRYAWRWSEDLKHVLEVLDLDGTPIYVEGRSESGLICMMPKTALMPLLPMHHDQWVVCALVEVNANDGSVAGTGKAAWIPVSGPSGTVCLPENERPTIVFTQKIIETIRLERSKTFSEVSADWEEREKKREKDRWNRNYDMIRNESTAFANVPGRRGHVSFPTPQSQLIN